MSQQNPLAGYFRSPKLYVPLPTQGKYYSPDVIDFPASGEVAVYAMTAKDELAMKNPDALLNGEAIAQVITSCVPSVKKPRFLISNDIDTLLIAIQGATYGDDIEVSDKCPNCSTENNVVASVDAVLSTMSKLEENYSLVLPEGLNVEIRPLSYESAVKAGVANFKTARSLQAITELSDELEQIRSFSSNFRDIALLNFELLVDSVACVRGTTANGEEFVVSDRKNIREFLENCDAAVGKAIEQKAGDINKVGVDKNIRIQCTACSHEFTKEVNFDPVNFFTAS